MRPRWLRSSTALSGRGHQSIHLRPLMQRRLSRWPTACGAVAGFSPRSAVARPASSSCCPAPMGSRRCTRVSVHPDLQRHGIASSMVAAAEELAAIRGFERVELLARAEFPDFIAFWQHRGFVVDRTIAHGVILTKPLPLAIKVPTSVAMVRLGERLAQLLERGDVILAAGDLGAGKTTLTQGIGRGLGSEGPIISPTFVLSRIHPSSIGRPTLMHVDAYRLATPTELDDLDLDATVADSITVVEWGQRDRRGPCRGSIGDRHLDRLRRTSRQPTMTASGSSRSAPSGPGGTMSISACCAVLIMVLIMAVLVMVGLIMTEAALVLALDTSTVVNVGLARGDRVLATATVADQMAHVEQLMPLVSECLDAAGAQVRDLEQVVVGLGPGPFTGLRVGVVTAQVLGQVLGLELRGICSLDVVAAQFAGAQFRGVRGCHRCPATRGVLGSL